MPNNQLNLNFTTCTTYNKLYENFQDYEHYPNNTFNINNNNNNNAHKRNKKSDCNGHNKLNSKQLFATSSANSQITHGSNPSGKSSSKNKKTDKKGNVNFHIIKEGSTHSNLALNDSVNCDEQKFNLIEETYFNNNNLSHIFNDKDITYKPKQSLLNTNHCNYSHNGYLGNNFYSNNICILPSQINTNNGNNNVNVKIAENTANPKDSSNDTTKLKFKKFLSKDNYLDLLISKLCLK